MDVSTLFPHWAWVAAYFGIGFLLASYHVIREEGADPGSFVLVWTAWPLLFAVFLLCQYMDFLDWAARKVKTWRRTS